MDVVSFGEDVDNSEVLTTFVNTLNGKVSKPNDSQKGFLQKSGLRMELAAI